jgi:hypothetical protein
MTTATITRLETATAASTVARAWTPRAGRLATTLLVVPAAIMMLAPFGLLGHAAIAQPEILSHLADNPLSALQLGVGLMISLLFCVLPFSSQVAHGPLIAAQPTAQQQTAVHNRPVTAPAFQSLAA